MILPRQARDKHRESTQKRLPFFLPAFSCRRARRNSYDEAYTLYDTALFLLNMNARNTANVSRPGCWVRKHVFLRHLITPPKCLPRQARDKHNAEKLKKGVFSAGDGRDAHGRGGQHARTLADKEQRANERERGEGSVWWGVYPLLTLDSLVRSDECHRQERKTVVVFEPSV